jgi:hypothetical protein
MIRSRHRLPFALRVFVLGMLALGMALMPVLASVGELHELAHDPSGSHGLATHGEHHDAAVDSRDDGESGVAGEDGLGSDPLHALLHYAHCCGQQSVTGARLMPVLAQPAAGAALLMPRAQVVPYAPVLAPFRPPITT